MKVLQRTANGVRVRRLQDAYYGKHLVLKNSLNCSEEHCDRHKPLSTGSYIYRLTKRSVYPDCFCEGANLYIFLSMSEQSSSHVLDCRPKALIYMQWCLMANKFHVGQPG